LINSLNFLDPNRVQVNLGLDAIANCAKQGIPLAGNAGGNIINWYDLSNANTHVPQVNNGALYTPNKKRSRVFGNDYQV
jgi:hypothetical protein